jgi:hypothetical protein
MGQGKAVHCAVILVLLAGASLAAQDHPDLSGRWVLESPSQAGPEVPRALSVRRSLVRTMERGPMKPFFFDMIITREFEKGPRVETYRIGVVGGTVPGVSKDGSDADPGTRHSAQWDGHSLVIESGTQTAPTRESGVWTERREAWSLDPDGRLRVGITTRDSVDPPKTETLLYRRQ